MDPDLRIALLSIGLLFVGAFAFMTVSVASDTGFDIFTLTAIIICLLIGAGLVGAIRNPPPDE